MCAGSWMAMAERDERRSGRRWPDFAARLTRYTSAVGQDKDGCRVANDGGHATNGGDDRDEGGDGRAGRRRQSDGCSRWRRPSRTTAATRLTLQTAATEQDGWLCGGRGYGVDRKGRMRRVGGSEETAAAWSTRSAVAVEEGRPGELKRRRTPWAGPQKEGCFPI